jgi:hypothetical protein
VTGTPHPRPLKELDADLAAALAGMNRLRWLAVTGVILLLIAAVVYLGVMLAGREAELAASCAQWKILAATPLNPVPPLTRPSQLGIQIVVASHASYQAGCGPLAPLPASVLRWAAFYHLPVPPNGI